MTKFVLSDTQPDITKEDVSEVDGVCWRGEQCGGDGVRMGVRDGIQQHLPDVTCR